MGHEAGLLGFHREIQLLIAQEWFSVMRSLSEDSFTKFVHCTFIIFQPPVNALPLHGSFVGGCFCTIHPQVTVHFGIFRRQHHPSCLVCEAITY